MRKFSEMSVGEEVVFNALVENLQKRFTPNKKAYYSLGLTDGETIIDARVWDETLVDAVTREVLEETKVAIPKHLWKQVAIADDPNKDELQNVTVRVKAYITKDEYEEYRLLGKNAMGVDGGEENEVECVKLIKLDTETVNSLEWAFNHKSLVENEIAFANLLKPFKK